MGIRPAKCVRSDMAQPWARISKRKPRKSYVKGAPHPKTRQYNMGTDKRFDLEVEMVADQQIQFRDNSIEAARQAANKYLEKTLIDNFFMQVVAFPHLVLREHSALGVAGADRISKGMKLSFGRPKGRLARVEKGHAVFRARVMQADLPALKEAFKRAKLKLSGTCSLTIRDIRNDPVNLARSVLGRKMKKKEVEAPKAEAAAAAPAAEAGKEGAAAPAAEAEKKADKKDEKAPARKK